MLEADFEETAAVIRAYRLDDGTVELVPRFADPGDLQDFRGIGGLPDKAGRFCVDARRSWEVLDRLAGAGFIVTGGPIRE